MFIQELSGGLIPQKVGFSIRPHDSYNYTLGSIGSPNVVIAVCSEGNMVYPLHRPPQRTEHALQSFSITGLVVPRWLLVLEMGRFVSGMSLMAQL